MTPFRSILAHLDGGAPAAHRLAFAAALAEQHEARLQALCAVNPVPHDLALLHRHAARSRFERVSSQGGWPMGWETPTDEPPIPAFTRRALNADLLVLGQRDPRDDDTSTVPRDFVESVVVGSGTPSLVLPYRHEQPFGRFGTVLVAWQPRREAARALAAALPLLLRAPQVHLVTWLRDAEEARLAQQQVVEHLRLHGIDGVDRHRDHPPHDTGAGLLALADGVGADLLVMGCYGHSPAHELVLGGATRTVLREMHLPVLMAR